MPTLRFIGRVLPEGLGLTLTDHPEITSNTPVLGKMRMVLDITKSRVTLTCDSEKISPARFQEAFVVARQLANLVVNLYAFKYGVGVQMWFDTVQEGDGQPRDIAYANPRLADEVKSFDYSSPTYQQLIEAIGPRYFFFAAALDDLIKTKFGNEQTTINCGRAIETLRQFFAEESDGKERKPAWKRMAAALRITENYTLLIRDNATGPRHGAYQDMTGPTTTEIVRRSWVIMDRFISHQIRGGIDPLPTDAFPLLDS